MSVALPREGRSRVYLKSPLVPAMGFLEAELRGVRDVIPLEFVRAEPEQLSLLVDKLRVKADSTDTVKITAMLRRESGVVTPGTWVLFSIAAPSMEVGRFWNTQPSDGTGSATVQLSPSLGTEYRGVVTICATHAETGIESEVIVEFVDP